MQKQRSLTASRKEEELAEIGAKQAEIISWIESQIGEKVPSGDNFVDSLADGVTLCKLLNSIKPDAIKKFHRKPKMLMMKMENIAFFLASCKSRCHIPASLLFSPGDVQDADLHGTRKILNVLLLLKQEATGGPTAEQAAATLATQEAERESVIEKEAEEARKRGEQLFETKKSSSYEPDIGCLDDNEVTSVSSATPLPPLTPLDNTWYVQGKPEPADVQNLVLAEINNVINQELSLETKKRLIRHLQNHILFVQHKLMSSSIPQLQALAHQAGLGTKASDVPGNKDRQWYIDFILKHGRLQ